MMRSSTRLYQPLHQMLLMSHVGQHRRDAPRWHSHCRAPGHTWSSIIFIGSGHNCTVAVASGLRVVRPSMVDELHILPRKPRGCAGLNQINGSNFQALRRSHNRNMRESVPFLLCSTCAVKNSSASSQLPSPTLSVIVSLSVFDYIDMIIP